MAGDHSRKPEKLYSTAHVSTGSCLWVCLTPWQVFGHRGGKRISRDHFQLDIQALAARRYGRCELKEVTRQSQIMLSRSWWARRGAGDPLLLELPNEFTGSRAI